MPRIFLGLVRQVALDIIDIPSDIFDRVSDLSHFNTQPLDFTNKLA